MTPRPSSAARRPQPAPALDRWVRRVDARAHSALTLRAVLAGFGLLFCTVAAVLMIRAGLTVLGVVLAVLAAVTMVDLGWVIHRKRRGEPG